VQYKNIKGVSHYYFNGNYFKTLETYQILYDSSAEATYQYYVIKNNTKYGIKTSQFESTFGRDYYISEDNLTAYVYKDRVTSFTTEEHEIVD
ncbi:hypothetical protein, partial [Salmonella enterica]|uniref:hypothetical protein n=1 Tax=Salmonella enterica TaxID=28901 RepID=UPI003CF13C7C